MLTSRKNLAALSSSNDELILQEIVHLIASFVSACDHFEDVVTGNPDRVVTKFFSETRDLRLRTIFSEWIFSPSTHAASSAATAAVACDTTTTAASAATISAKFSDHSCVLCVRRCSVLLSHFRSL